MAKNGVRWHRLHGKGVFSGIYGLARHGKEWYAYREFQWELGLDMARCGMLSSRMERYFLMVIVEIMVWQFMFAYVKV